jgi:hypothetical protein
MGKMNLIKANWYGKVGQTVGAKWKTESTIRSFTPPSNPKTPGQQEVRTGFKDLTVYFSLIAPQLKRLTSLDTRAESVRNALIKLNKDQIKAATLDPSALELNHGGLPPLVLTKASAASDTVTISFTAPSSPIISTSAVAVGVWYKADKSTALVAEAALSSGSIAIPNATGAATGDSCWAWLIDYRGSSRVGSPSGYILITA